jgi:hypothetical protein
MAVSAVIGDTGTHAVTSSFTRAGTVSRRFFRRGTAVEAVHTARTGAASEVGIPVPGPMRTALAVMPAPNPRLSLLERSPHWHAHWLSLSWATRARDPSGCFVDA